MKELSDCLHLTLHGDYVKEIRKNSLKFRQALKLLATMSFDLGSVSPEYCMRRKFPCARRKTFKLPKSGVTEAFVHNQATEIVAEPQYKAAIIPLTDLESAQKETKHG